MNRKAQETSTRNIIMAVIAAVVLVVAILGVYLFFSEGAGEFFKFLPDFNASKPPAVDLEILNYDIATGKIQLYDGTRWIDFEKQGSAELSRKKIVYNIAQSDFDQFFYFSRPGDYKEGALSFSIVPLELGAISPGTVIIERSGDRFAIDMENKVIPVIFDGTKYEKTDKFSWYSEEERKSLVIKAEEYRSAVLDKSFEIRYTDMGINQAATVLVCADKERYFVDRQLVVNLAVPVNGESCA